VSGIQALDRIPAPMLLLTAASLWGCSNVVQKTVLNNLGPLTALSLSSIVAAIVLSPFARRELVLATDQARMPLKSYIAPIAAFVWLTVTSCLPLSWPGSSCGKNLMSA
jgi:drug/metabolite transporter (DMT)-like permease